MKMHRQIVTMIGVLAALTSTQKVYGMQKIHDYFSKSSTKKEESQPPKDDSRMRPSSVSREEKSSPRQSREELNKTLGELLPGESARNRGRASRNEIEISGPRNFRDLSTPEAEKLKRDAATIAGDERALVGLKDRQLEKKTTEEPVKESRSLLQRARDAVRSKKEESEKETSTVFRKTTDETLAKMKPEERQMIREARAQEALKAQISAATEGAQWSKNTPASEKMRTAIAQESVKTEAAKASKEQADRLDKLAQAVKSSKTSDLTPEKDPKKQIQIEKMTTEKNDLMVKLNETRNTIKTEEAKAGANRDEAALKKLYLEKKKLGDQLTVKSKALENATNQMNLTSLSSKDLLNKVNSLQTESIAAQKRFEQANKDQIDKQANLKAALNSLPEAKKKEYKELSAAHKEIEDKIQDKTTPKDQISQLIVERRAIKEKIGNINPNLLVQHDSLLNHEATFITAKKDAQVAQQKTQIAASILEQRLEKEAEAAKKPDIESKPKKSVGFSEVAEKSDNQSKKEYDPAAVPAKGILKKSVGFSEPQEQTQKSSSPQIDEKSLAAFEKKGTRPPTALPNLPDTKEPELSAAMKRKIAAEERAFNARTPKQEESFSPSKFD